MSAANSSPEAAPRLPRLWWWDDGVERSGAAHMAVDELLFSSHPEVPVLRAYRWLAPAVSFGYAERFEPVHARFSGQAREFVRRWTGGGVVPHGGDMTYTLVLPATVRGAWKNSVAVYRMVHQALADALCRDGLPAVMVESGRQSTGTLCFAAPVRYDVLADGAKVAGAGQRRTQAGILHQGSMQGAAARPGVVRALANGLAVAVVPMPEDLIPCPPAVDALVSARYGDSAWTTRR